MASTACARCGTAVDTGEHLCWRCQQELPIERPVAANVTPGAEGRTFRGQPVPDGMVLPSRTQYHGTVFGAIAVGMVIVLALGVFVNRGVGPFRVSNEQTSAGGSLSIGPVATATVKNIGNHAGQARCVAFWDDQNGGGHTPVATTPTIKPDQRVRISIRLPAGALSQSVSITCK